MEILYLTLLTLVASIVGTVTGFGISTIMVPVVLFFLPLPETLLFVGLVHWFGDIWKMVLFKSGLNWKILIFFGIPGIVTSYLGARLVISLPEKLLSQFIGILLVSYVIFIFFKPSFKIKPGALSGILGGAGSGFLGGLTGVGGGALRAVVLTAFNLPKSVYIFTSGILGFLIDASRITTYFLEGIRITQVLTLGLIIFIPTTFLGAKIAQKIVNRVDQESFRILIATFLLIIGLKFTIWP